MRGWICNGCAEFHESDIPPAVWEHRVEAYDPNTGHHGTKVVRADLCDDCAIDQSKLWGLIPDEPVGEGDD